MFGNTTEAQIAIEKDRVKTALRALRVGLPPNVVAEVVQVDVGKVEMLYNAMPADLIEKYDPYRDRCKAIVDMENDAISKAMQDYCPYMAVCLLDLDIPIRIVSALTGLDVGTIEKIDRNQILSRSMEPKQHQDPVFKDENGTTRVNMVLALDNTVAAAARTAIYEDANSIMMVMLDHGVSRKIVDRVFQDAEIFAATI